MKERLLVSAVSALWTVSFGLIKIFPARSVQVSAGRKLQTVFGCSLKRGESCPNLDAK